MVKIKFLISFIIFFSVALAQDSSMIRAGLIRAQATLSPSYMFADRQSYFYLHGNLEVFSESRVSIAGEGYLFLGNISSDKPVFDYNHNLFFGVSYHFVKKTNDLYIGIQPGLTFTRLNRDENNLARTTGGINPVISVVSGYNFYINNFFHYFLQGRMIVGQNYFDFKKDLTEFRFSAGLGFNINAIK